MTCGIGTAEKIYGFHLACGIENDGYLGWTGVAEDAASCGIAAGDPAERGGFGIAHGIKSLFSLIIHQATREMLHCDHAQVRGIILVRFLRKCQGRHGQADQAQAAHTDAPALPTATPR